MSGKKYELVPDEDPSAPAGGARGGGGATTSAPVVAGGLLANTEEFKRYEYDYGLVFSSASRGSNTPM